MKRVYMILISVLFFAANSDAQRPITSGNNECSAIVIQGCLGSCETFSSAFSGSYVVPSTIHNINRPTDLCFDVTGLSLCPNTIAIAQIERNGHRIMQRTLESGFSKTIKAKPGDVVSVHVRLEPAPHSQIVCIWAGNIHFQLAD